MDFSGLVNESFAGRPLPSSIAALDDVQAPDQAPFVRNPNLEAKTATLVLGDSLEALKAWDSPTCIIADGPYGLGLFPGEPLNPDGLDEWYAPHAAAWASKSLPGTTLWFWNSEIGWAKSHPALERAGWRYEETIIWDKGIAHLAGKVNSKTIRGVPVVTEIAVRYTRDTKLASHNGELLPLKDWVRSEWLRSGLPMNQANDACGVRNAATRKYLTQCHLWYFPPGDAIVAMAEWCTHHGRETDRPYFSIDGTRPPQAQDWDRMRAKWNHAHGVTNVWSEPPVHGRERIKAVGSTTKVAHANQKPVALMERQILASTDAGDVVWEPFGGLCSASVAAIRTGRRAFSAEMNESFFPIAKSRLEAELAKGFT